MKVQTVLKWVPAAGLLCFCGPAMSDELQILAEVKPYSESGLLLAVLALVLGFTVVARRSPHSSQAMGSSTGDSAAAGQEQAPRKATVHNLVTPSKPQPSGDSTLPRTASNR